MKITSRGKFTKLSNGLNIYSKTCFPLDIKSRSHVFIIPGISFLGTERYSNLQRFLAHNSISSTSYDYRGVGYSSGNIDKTRLKDLINDSKIIFSKFSDQNIYVVGYSIGGYVALRILKELLNIKGLILITPPVFSKKADKVLLNEANRNYIKANLQDSRSALFTSLVNSKISTIILFGNKDEKISTAVINRYKAITNESIKFAFIDNGAHALLNDRTAVEKIAKEDLFLSIFKFISR